MTGSIVWIEAAGAVVLLAGLGYAAVADVRTREVSDGLWQALGVVGALLGFLLVASAGTLPVVLWAVVSALALEHLFPWDDALGERHAGNVPAIEVGAYVVVIGTVGYAAVRWGVGPASVPLPVLAALVTVVTARVLFEMGVLYGGADAKALIVAGLLVPLFPVPVVLAPAVTSAVLGVMPFSFTLLTDAALLSVVVPVVIAVKNATRGEFSFPGGFTTYTLDVNDLPHRFVWVRDRALGEDTFLHDAETSAEDTERRTEIASQLKARGVTRVWVSPQLPFLVLMAAGALAGVLAGNLLLDLLAAL